MFLEKYLEAPRHVELQIFCDNQEEIDYYWEQLSEGGSEGPCGWLTDKFGLSWQVVPTGMEELFSDPDPTRAEARGWLNGELKSPE